MSSAVIVSLDVNSHRDAFALVSALGEAARSYKVGLQLLTAEGPTVVRDLVVMGKDVFIDLKLHEIPSSVGAAVTAAGKLGAAMVTVHASAGAAVLEAAVKASAAFPRLKVLALTVITSLSDSDLPEIGLPPSVHEQVERLARLAARAGCHGVVASAHEAAFLSEILPRTMLIVTPGIQLHATSVTDQARAATPEKAAAAGATHIVLGRAITQAVDPRAAYRAAVAAFESNDGLRVSTRLQHP